MIKQSSIFLIAGITMYATENAFFNGNIVELTKANENFRKVIATGKHSQVVLMSVLPSQDVGEETHTIDQIIIFVEGIGDAVINGKKSTISLNDLFFVPAGTKHNFINTGKTPLKLYTIYAPAEYEHGFIEKIKPIE